MDHKREKTYSIPNRIGFHYFPDGFHYGDKDLELWLPRLKQMNAQWLVLDAGADRAIPEDFIHAFSQAHIKTILDFNRPLAVEPGWSDLETLLRSYGKWGVNYAILDQRPNSQNAWGSNFWKTTDLVANYVRRFTRFAGMALDCGIRPVFAPLIPGGDYWDLAFMESALKILSDSVDAFTLNNIAISAYAWDFGHALDWGAGGPQAWREVKAYKTPSSSQDQRGFRAYEWYAHISQNVLGKKLPILMLQAGLSGDPQGLSSANPAASPEKQLHVYRLLREENVYDPENSGKLFKAVPPEVRACNFYALCDESKLRSSAWFAPDGSPRALAQAVSQILPQVKSVPQQDLPNAAGEEKTSFQYDRYILVADSLKPHIQEILRKMHAYITRHKPLVGFSIEEAKKSASILVIAQAADLPAGQIDQLRSGGSLVKMLDPQSLNFEINEPEK